MNKKTLSYTIGAALAAALLVTAPALAADATGTTRQEVRKDIQDLKQETRNDIRGAKANADKEIRDIKEDARDKYQDIREDARDKYNDAKTDIRETNRQLSDDAATQSRNMRNDVKTTAYATGDTSDRAVNDRVETTLQSYNDVDAATDNGVVTLTGTVKTQQEKESAVSRARNISGVKSVKDELKVEGQGNSQGISGYVDDASTTTVVKGKFLGQKGLDSLDISVETNNGVVTLNGDVETASQVRLAEDVAKEADGVKRVVNNLQVKS